MRTNIIILFLLILTKLTTANEIDSLKTLEDVRVVDSSQSMLLSYSAIIPYLVEAIKEQQTIIDQQNLLINDQETRINNMESEINNCCTIIHNEVKSEQAEGNSIINETTNIKPVLYQNTPNPFNKKTIIRYFIPETSVTSSILVFDMQGKLVKTYPISTKGDSNIEISAGELQPGMYMYSLITGSNEIDTKKMIITE